MAKRKAFHKVTQPFRPALSIILICVVVIGCIILLLLRNTHRDVQQQLQRQTPSLAPTPTLSLAPTPTLAYGQTAIYTYYVRATPQKTVTQLIRLTPSRTGRQFVADIGALFSLKGFKEGHSNITSSSPQNIFTNYGPPEILNFSVNAIATFRVYREGDGIIQVVETEESPPPTPVPHITYTSHKLGISFTYTTMVRGVQNFFTREIGNKVYLYYTFGRSGPFKGTDSQFSQAIAPGAKYVEVFSKKPAESLEMTLTHKFLQGYSLNDCPILPETLPKSALLPSRQAVKISLPRGSYESFADSYAAEKRCPPIYTDAGRDSAYFMMDPNHLNKFVFFKIGQDDLPSGIFGKGTWDTSIDIF